MSTTITNYDGGIVTTPQQHVHPKSVQELQEILRDRQTYPGPVRAMGSNHSLTPCVVSTGTVVDMDGFSKVLRIDAEAMTVTSQAGAQLVDVAAALRKLNLQFMSPPLVIEKVQIDEIIDLTGKAIKATA